MFYPFSPIPSHISVPAVIDPVLRYSVDQGYEIRRPRYSRPRRRYTLEYLGKTTTELRVIRNFLMMHRLGVTPFEWLHSTAFDNAQVTSTTPVALTFIQHPFVDGDWVYISNATPNTSINGPHQILYFDPTAFYLLGTTAGGVGTCSVSQYLPRAVGRFAEDTMESPVKLIGPESTISSQGRFSWQVVVEEVF